MSIVQIGDFGTSNLYTYIALELYEMLYINTVVDKRKLYLDRKKWHYISAMGRHITGESFKDRYNAAKNLLYDDEHFYESVLQFISFLRTMEKSIIYYNDEEDSDLYAYISDDESIAYLTYKDWSHSTTIKFEESKINNILSKGSSIIYDKPDSKLKFVEISIDRKYGKEMISKIKHIYPGGEPQLNDLSDEVMYKNAISEVREAMVECFDSVLNSIFDKFSDHFVFKHENTFLEEALNYGIYYRET